MAGSSAGGVQLRRQQSQQDKARQRSIPRASINTQLEESSEQHEGQLSGKYGIRQERHRVGAGAGISESQ